MDKTRADTCMRGTLERLGGEALEVSHPDLLLVARFREASLAVEWCVEVQAALPKETWSEALLAHPMGQRIEAEGRVIAAGLRLTMAIHSATLFGSVERGWFGPATDTAIALALSGAAGHILASDTTWTAARHEVGRSIAARDCGIHRFPDLEGAVQTWLIRADTSPPPPDDVVSSLGDATNLPRTAPPFVGRDAALEEIDTLLRRGAPVLTLLGPGGMGKTRLALRYAGRALWRYADHGGVWVCDLSEVRSLDRLVQAVAQALEVNLTVRGISALHQLGNALRDRGSTLLVLDGAESCAKHIATAVNRWQVTAPDVQVIATSRIRLDIRGEEALELQPLETACAVDLFFMAARARRVDLDVNETTHAQVRTIVERVESIPLAVELAAGWTDLLTTEQLMWRLKEDLAVLSGSPERNGRTVATVMELSWQLLERWEQDVLLQCAVFRGGFSLQAAEEVVSIAEGRVRNTATALTRLRDKSLLRTYHDQANPTQNRFGMYGVIQQYAFKRLQSSGWRATAIAKHAMWGVRKGQELSARAHAGESEAIRSLAIEQDNLYAIAERRMESKPAEAALALLCLEPLLSIRGPFDEHVRRMQEALRVAETAPASVRAQARRALAEALLSKGRASEAKLEAKKALDETRAGEPASRLRYVLSLALLDLGDPITAAQVVEEALQEAKDRDAALLRSAMGRIAFATGHIGRARHELTRAAEALTGARDIAITCAALGNVHRASGEPTEARAEYERALKLSRSIEDRHREAVVLGHLGSLHLDLDDRPGASQRFQRAIELFKEVGDRRSAAITTGNIGRLLHVQGSLGKAQQHYENACNTLTELGDLRFHALFLGNEGLLLHEAGKLERARQCYQKATASLRDIGDQRFAAVFVARLGAVLADTGDVDAARRLFAEAAERLEDLTDPVATSAHQLHEGHLRLAEGVTTAEVKRLYWRAMGTKDDPGLAAHSADVRLAARLLARRLTAKG